VTPDIVSLLVFCLASFRLTRLVVQDRVFYRMRELVWRRFPPESSALGYLFTCFWCMSIWAASALYICSIIAPEPMKVVSLILASSAVVGLLAAYENRL
jgi:hypothetical protein